MNTIASPPVTLREAPVSVSHVHLAQLRESPMNARKNFDKEKLQELADSIRTKGVLTPLLVRYAHPTPEDPSGILGEILAGARRFRAAKIAGLDIVPCIVRDVDDATALEILTIENLQREDLSALEEAQGFKALLDLGKYDVAELAKRVGKSQSYIYQRVKLTELAPDAKKALLDEKISAGHAILIARLQPPDQKRALQAAVGHDYRGPVSVRQLGEWIQEEIHLDLTKAPWVLADADLLPKAGSCTQCPKNEKNACLDPQCYEAKMRAHFTRIEQKLGKTRAVFRISAEYEGLKDGVYGTKAWRPAKPDSCPATAIGLAIDGGYCDMGDSSLRITRGQQLGICIDQKCKIHWKVERESPSSYVSIAKTPSQKAKERKDRAISDARTVAVGLIAGKTTWPLGVESLRTIALAFLERTTYDSTKLLAKSLGVWPADGKTVNFNFSGKLEARIQGADKQALAGTLVALGLLPAWGRWCGGSEEEKALRAAGKSAGVDAAKIEREAIARAELKAKSVKVRSGKTGKKPGAKKSHASAKAAKGKSSTWRAAKAKRKAKAA